MSTTAERPKIEFGCCFCGEAIPDEEGDMRRHGLALLDEHGDFLQQWWCHHKCFKDRLHREFAQTYDE